MAIAYIPDAADKPAPATTMIFLEPRSAAWNLAMASLMALLVRMCTRPHGVLICRRYPGARKDGCFLEVTLRSMTKVKEWIVVGESKTEITEGFLYETVHRVQKTTSDNDWRCGHDLPGVAGTVLVLPSAYHIVLRKGLRGFGCTEQTSSCRTHFFRPAINQYNAWGEWLQFARAESYLTFLQI